MNSFWLEGGQFSSGEDFAQQATGLYNSTLCRLQNTSRPPAYLAISV